VANGKTTQRAVDNLRSYKTEVTQEIKRGWNAASEDVNQLNLDLESVGGPAVRSGVANNLNKLNQVVDAGTNRIEATVKSSAARVESSMNRMGRIGSNIADLFGP
jgi:predicted phage gp36 major capsid-like protein